MQMHLRSKKNKKKNRLAASNDDDDNNNKNNNNKNLSDHGDIDSEAPSKWHKEEKLTNNIYIVQLWKRCFSDNHADVLKLVSNSKTGLSAKYRSLTLSI